MKVTARVSLDGLLRVDTRRARLAVARETERRCRSRVPCRTGALMESARVTEDGRYLIYGVPYAQYVYRGVTGAGRPLRYSGAPMRGPYWVSRMLAEEASELAAAAAEVIFGNDAGDP